MSDQPATPPQQALELVSDLSLAQRLDNALDEIHGLIVEAVLLNPLASVLGQTALDGAVERVYKRVINKSGETALRDIIKMYGPDDVEDDEEIESED